MTFERGDELTQRLLDGCEIDLASQLLTEVFGGYPVERLRPLVSSPHDAAVRAVAWILSELGRDARSMLPEVAVLLEHRLPYARFFALDAVLVCATVGDGATTAKAVALMTDLEPSLQWKALRFLAHAEAEPLGAAVPHLSHAQLSEIMGWLLAVERDAPSRDSEVVQRLASTDQLVQRFAAAAAARIGGRTTVPLELAARSGDTCVRDFARDEIDALRRRPRRR